MLGLTPISSAALAESEEASAQPQSLYGALLGFGPLASAPLSAIVSPAQSPIVEAVGSASGVASADAINASYLLASHHDAYFDRNVALLHSNGSNDSTTITDSSSVGAAWSTFGNAKLKTAQKKFGTASVYFDGGVGGYIRTASPAAANGLGHAYTIECWIYPTTLVQQGIWFIGPSSNDSQRIQLVLQPDGSLGLYAAGDSSINITTSAGAVVANQWQHVACVRDGRMARIYVDGVVKSVASTYTGSRYNYSDYIYVGMARQGSAEKIFNGYIDEFRVTKGICRYGRKFSPQIYEYESFLTPTPITIALSQFEATTGTSPFAGDSVGADFVPYGSAALSTGNKKFGSKSLSLNGTTDYVGNSGIAGQFYQQTAYTIEGWFYRDTNNTGQDTLFGFHDSTGANRDVFTADTGMFGDDVSTTSFSQSIPVGSWFHFAAVRSSDGRWRAFLDGTKVLDIASSGNNIALTDSFSIGQEYDSATPTDFWDGNVDGLRIVRGLALYSEDFTPSSSPPFEIFVSEATGSAAGVASVSAVGAEDAGANYHSGAGASTGVATSAAVGESTAESTASSSSVASAVATGQSTAGAMAAASGVSTVTAIGEVTQDGVGASSGFATAGAVGQATVEAIANAAGGSAVLAYSSAYADGDGFSAGLATVAAIASALHVGNGVSAGVATAVATSGSIASGAGVSASITVVVGVSVPSSGGDGLASGTSSVLAVSEVIFAAVGYATGTSNVAAVGVAWLDYLPSDFPISHIKHVASYSATKVVFVFENSQRVFTTYAAKSVRTEPKGAVVYTKEVKRAVHTEPQY